MNLSCSAIILGGALNQTVHVKEMRRKFGARAWVLRILKHAGIPTSSLIDVYRSLVRPILDHPSNLFHSMLTDEMSQALERLRRVALKSIYGLSMSYADCLRESGLQLLSERRSELLLEFAKKIGHLTPLRITLVPTKRKIVLLAEERRKICPKLHIPRASTKCSNLCHENNLK